jgi:hypothetical protein
MRAAMAGRGGNKQVPTSRAACAAAEATVASAALAAAGAAAGQQLYDDKPHQLYSQKRTLIPSQPLAVRARRRPLAAGLPLRWPLRWALPAPGCCCMLAAVARSQPLGVASPSLLRRQVVGTSAPARAPRAHVPHCPERTPRRAARRGSGAARVLRGGAGALRAAGPRAAGLRPGGAGERRCLGVLVGVRRRLCALTAALTDWLAWPPCAGCRAAGLRRRLPALASARCREIDYRPQHHRPHRPTQARVEPQHGAR